MPAPDHSGAEPSVIRARGPRDNLRSSAVKEYAVRPGHANSIAQSAGRGRREQRRRDPPHSWHTVFANNVRKWMGRTAGGAEHRDDDAVRGQQRSPDRLRGTRRPGRGSAPAGDGPGHLALLVAGRARGPGPGHLISRARWPGYASAVRERAGMPTGPAPEGGGPAPGA